MTSKRASSFLANCLMASCSSLAQYSTAGNIRLVITLLNLPLTSLFKSATKSCLLQNANFGQIKCMRNSKSDRVWFYPVWNLALILLVLTWWCQNVCSKYFQTDSRDREKGITIEKSYPIEFNVECFRNGLTLGVWSLAKNVNDDFFIGTEAFHRNSTEKHWFVNQNNS